MAPRGRSRRRELVAALAAPCGYTPVGTEATMGEDRVNGVTGPRGTPPLDLAYVDSLLNPLDWHGFGRMEVEARRIAFVRVLAQLRATRAALRRIRQQFSDDWAWPRFVPAKGPPVTISDETR